MFQIEDFLGTANFYNDSKTSVKSAANNALNALSTAEKYALEISKRPSDDKKEEISRAVKQAKETIKHISQDSKSAGEGTLAAIQQARDSAINVIDKATGKETIVEGDIIVRNIVSDNTADLSYLQAEINDLHSSNRVLLLDNKAKQLEINRLNAEVSRLNIEIAKLTEDVQDRDTIIATKDLQIQQLQAQLTTAQQDLLTAQQDLLTAQQQLAAHLANPPALPIPPIITPQQLQQLQQDLLTAKTAEQKAITAEQQAKTAEQKAQQDLLTAKTAEQKAIAAEQKAQQDLLLAQAASAASTAASSPASNISMLQAVQQKAIEEKEKAEKDLLAVQQQLSASQAALSASQAALSASQAALATSQTAEQKAKQSASDATVKFNLADAEITLKDSALKDATDKITELEQKITSANTARDTALDAKTAAEQTVTEKTAELAKLQKVELEKKAVIAEYKKLDQKKAEDAAAFTAKITELEQKIKDIGAATQAPKVGADPAIQALNKQLREEKDALQKQLQEEKTKFEEFKTASEKEIGNLKFENEFMSEAVSDASLILSERDKAEASLDQAKKDLAASEQQIKELEKALATSKKSLETFQQNLAQTIETEKKRIEADVQRDITKLTDDIADLEEKITNLTTKMEKLNAEKDAIQKENDEMRKKLQTMIEELKTANREKSKLEQEKSDITYNAAICDKQTKLTQADLKFRNYINKETKTAYDVTISKISPVEQKIVNEKMERIRNDFDTKLNTTEPKGIYSDIVPDINVEYYKDYLLSNLQTAGVNKIIDSAGQAKTDEIESAMQTSYKRFIAVFEDIVKDLRQIRAAQSAAQQSKVKVTGGGIYGGADNHRFTKQAGHFDQISNAAYFSAMFGLSAGAVYGICAVMILALILLIMYFIGMIRAMYGSNHMYSNHSRSSRLSDNFSSTIPVFN